MTGKRSTRFKAFTKRYWMWVAVLSGVLIALLLHQYFSVLSEKAVKFYEILGNRHHLKKTILSFKKYAPLVYILIQMLQVVVAPIPGGATEFLGGYIFGVKAGFLFSMIGVTLGSLVAFLLARTFGKRVLERFVSPQAMKKFEYLIGHEGVIISLLLFLIPGFPKDALCYILGLTPMHLGIFLIVSTIGRVPGTWVAALEGAKAYGHHYKTLFILLGVSAFAIMICYYYHERIHTLIKELRKPEQKQPS